MPKALIDVAGDRAHAMQTPIADANQWISQAPVTSLLVQTEAESKRVIRGSRKTTEISQSLFEKGSAVLTPLAPSCV